MSVPKKILAACDNSPQAAEVVDYAAGLAHKTGAALILAHIIDIRGIEAVQHAFGRLPNLEGIEWSKYRADLVRDRYFELKQLLGMHRDKQLEVETVVNVGMVYKELLALVDDRKADLLVVGASRHNLLSEHLMGSTANKLFRLCPIPLISVGRSMLRANASAF